MKIGIAISMMTIFLILWLQPFEIGEKKVFIPRGFSGAQIAHLLEQNRITRSKIEFLFWLKLLNKEHRLKSGEYTLKVYKNPIYLIQKLTRGVRSDVEVTIPEGWTVTEIARFLESKGLIEKKSFLDLCYNQKFLSELGIKGPSVEGYLFPDTYFFSHSQGDSQIIRIFVENFYRHIRKITDVQGDSLLKIITLASLVEKEAKYDEERPVIARVFLNRLKLHKPLESCATVIYAKHLKNPDLIITSLTEKDLRFESPYNTYLNKGLPPGPICSPGEKSILAVLNPADVDYLYFVLRSNGRHHFSRTYREHLIARDLYNAQK